MTISADPTTIAGCVAGVLAVPEASKGVRKLCDTVADQIGLFLQPYHTRRIAEANADAREIEERNKVAVQVIRAEGRLVIKDVPDRAAERGRLNQERQQRNIEAIVTKAVDELPGPEVAVSDVPVEPDWTARFIGKCQDVSDETMQRLWAKVLAGETAQPGSFSRKTLSIVEVMTKSDAELFTQLCTALWNFGGEDDTWIFNPGCPADAASAGLDFEALLHLENLGLIDFDSKSGFMMEVMAFDDQEGMVVPCRYFGHLYGLIKHPKSKRRLPKNLPGTPKHLDPNDKRFINQTVQSGVALLTASGVELARIAGSVPKGDYLDAHSDHLQDLGWLLIDVEIEGEPPLSSTL